MHYEILGADRASRDELGEVVSVALSLPARSIRPGAVHFTAPDGVTTVAVMTSDPVLGPATFFTSGPASEALAGTLLDAFKARGWSVRALGGRTAA